MKTTISRAKRAIEALQDFIDSAGYYDGKYIICFNAKADRIRFDASDAENIFDRALNKLSCFDESEAEKARAELCNNDKIFAEIDYFLECERDWAIDAFSKNSCIYEKDSFEQRQIDTVLMYANGFNRYKSQRFRVGFYGRSGGNFGVCGTESLEDEIGNLQDLIELLEIGSDETDESEVREATLDVLAIGRALRWTEKTVKYFVDGLEESFVSNYEDKIESEVSELNLPNMIICA